MGTLVDKLAYWQSKSFYTLANVGGKLVEEDVGPTRPKAVPFVKGGRRAALATAKERWPGAAVEAAAKAHVRAMQQRVADESGDVEDEPEPRGEKPDMGQPLEDEDRPAIAERRPRVSPARGPITRQRFEPITKTLSGRGLSDV